MQRRIPLYGARGRALVESSLTFWPRFDFRTEYINLVSDPVKIMKYSRRGDVDSTGATAISHTAPPGAGQAMGTTDLAAALCLDYAINGFDSERFEHVVVDEAQDVSPLEIELMRMHSANNSFTILGDLQRILPYKSIRNWSACQPVRAREARQPRSTRQITLPTVSCKVSIAKNDSLLPQHVSFVPPPRDASVHRRLRTEA